MPRWLDYPTQVSELEKMARLAPAGAPVSRPLPGLGRPDPERRCLVCGVAPARACAGCGGVSYCGAAHQQLDARWHDPVCESLRDIAEDASIADGTCPEGLVSELRERSERARDIRVLAGWDDYLGDDPLLPVRRRQLADLATRPLTLAAAVAALDASSRAARPGSLAIHVMAAARRELAVPLTAWGEASRLLPGSPRLELTLVGPELSEQTDGAPAASAELSERTDAPTAAVSLRVRSGLYGKGRWGELGRPDLVIGYDCGLLMYPTWKATILELRGSGVPFVITSFRGWEAAAEARLLAAVKATCLIAPEANPWASPAGKRSTTIANDVSFDNAFVSAWR